jgi:hypothetical protein
MQRSALSDQPSATKENNSQDRKNFLLKADG